MDTILCKKQKHSDDPDPNVSPENSQVQAPLKGVVFEVYLKSAGSYEKAKATERDLQRQFDASVNEILSIEKSKSDSVAMVALIVGFIGTAFMAGAVLTVTSGFIIPCIILAVPAFIGWTLPYFLYKSTYSKKTAKVTPLIDNKYDEIYKICSNGEFQIAGRKKQALSFFNEMCIDTYVISSLGHILQLANKQRDIIKTNNNDRALVALREKYPEVELRDEGIRIYGEEESVNVSAMLYY